ncbi:TIGR04283 family arsenosugar biosynthesis glycosyltransferase [uncultured Formosa sp.]|uniref:TIGR04283 family arsenosugar biosynthesis glycosyltransferase n=1 Tax=uncultured Formosa sp. TaxID=255435 RepID=UPI0026193306|nr:TIGR04283 family arsenosugar biosynthesis glycosyltransferase [uncultured Formosa sp.]
MSKISIIIPTFNEAKNLQELIPYLLKNASSINIKEIIIVDGGSTDQTQEVVNVFTEVSLLHSEKGRGKQMNLGAKQAKGNILYFLHADSYPPENFDNYILKSVNSKTQAGCFKMSFNSSHWLLKLSGWLTQFTWKISRGGDQSLFITKALFETLGGYNEEYKIYEDNHFINSTYKATNFTVIQQKLTTSARRYHIKGIYFLQYHYSVIHLKYRLGNSPQTLYDYYLKHVSVKN